MRSGCLERLDVGCRRTLLALRHVERYLLSLFQRLVARHLDRRVMGKEILAAVIRGDEAEAFRVVEPLHGTCSHVACFLSVCEANPGLACGHDDQGRNWTATSTPRRGGGGTAHFTA